MESGGSGVVDFGRFLTGFLVVMGIGMSAWHITFSVLHDHETERHTDLRSALPVLFAHCALINEKAAAMSVVGGLLIYGTIISFTMFFQESEDF